MKKNATRISLPATLLFLIHFNVWAQNKILKGRVTDDKNLPVPGATVTAKGTTVGTTTSAGGEFSLSVPATADSLVISAVGYTRLAVAVTDNLANLALVAATSSLGEVIVVGYGTQKKGDLTAPITTVNTDEMLKRTTATPMEALQGSVPGVQVITNGAPGSSPNVRIRGVGSFNNENPLYVVDGMFVDNIDFLNPNDIADMSILKDASGAAIYGVRAANGVVLITTKKGKLNMKTRVTYNAYVGYQVPANKIKMADGRQFTNFLLQRKNRTDSSVVEASVSRFGGSGLNPATSTDWYGELLRKKALITNHGIDLLGGSNNISYSFGVNYTYQNGSMNANNDYTRYNVRFQMEAQAFSWLRLGVTTTLSNSTIFRPNLSAFSNAFTAAPLFPVYDEKNVNAFPVRFANSATIGSGSGNPVADAYYNYDRFKEFQVLPSVYVEASFWKNKLTFRSQLSQLYSSGLSTNYSQERSLGPGRDTTRSHLSSAQERNTNYILDNLLTYKDGIGRHHWTLLLGHSARQEQWRITRVQADNVPKEEEFWYTRQGATFANYYDEDGFRNTGLSFFTRGTYDFDNKYLLTATFRADGSSKYQTKWGYFPSIGLGWVLSRENFMAHQHVFDFLKLRGSWGKLGNDGVRPNAGYAIVNMGNPNSAVFGSTATGSGSYVPGYVVNRFFASISWEVVTEWDGGIDFEMLNRRLKGSVDYYNRKTKGAALERPFAFGAPNIYGNWADMENSGFDIALSWNDRIGKVGYQVSGNLSTLKNKVTNLGSLANIAGGFPEWNAELPNRIKVGEPINYFYGYEVTGVYQNQHEVDSDPMAKAENDKTPGSVQPGYFKYRDVNGNGIKDDDDRVNLGSYLPKITYGFNISLDYNNFDLSIAFQGVGGNKLVNLNRAKYLKGNQALNTDAKFIESLWTGEGSTNRYPSASALMQSWNKPGGSSFFVEKGDYLRVQNIQLGYTFKLNSRRSPIGLRVFATADRPLIFTRYSGFTPEISGVGYDANVYPVSSTYSLGLRASF